jgi:hypothetical protein
VCFDSELRLRKCLLTAHNLSPSNADIHLRRRHTRQEVPAYWDKVAVRDTGTVGRNPSSSSVPMFRVDKGQTIMEHSTSSDVANQAEQLLYRFFNTANVAMNQTSNVYLNELIQLLIAKGAVCKKANKIISFSTHRYKEQEIKVFATFVSFVTKAISTAREYYVGRTGKQIPFLNVGHDGWDSKRKDILGVTLHLVHPERWVTIALPIGLKHAESKKSEEMYVQINKILSR